MTKTRFVVAALGAALFWGGVVSLSVNGRPLFRSACAADVVSSEGAQVQERSQALQPGGLCDLELVSGSIVVRPAQGSVAKLRAVIKQPARAQGRKERVRVDMGSDPRSLWARTVYPQDGFHWGGDQEDPEVSYTLELPASARLRVKTVSGDVEVAAAPAGATIHTVSGEVKVQRAGGEVRVESVSGDVSLGAVSGRLQVQTVSGDVDGLLEAGLVSGDIKTVSGEIDLHAPRRLGLQVSATSMSGEVESDFAGGPVPLRLNTLSGDIKVKHNG